MWIKVPSIDYGFSEAAFVVGAREIIGKKLEHLGLLPFPVSVLKDESERVADAIEVWFTSVIGKLWPEYSGGTLISFGNNYISNMLNFSYTHKNLPRTKVGNRMPYWFLLDRCLECRVPISYDGEYDVIAVNLSPTSGFPGIYIEKKLCEKCGEKINSMKGKCASHDK